MNIISFYKLTGIIFVIITAYEIAKGYCSTLSESLILAKDALNFVRHANDSIYYKELPVSKIFETYKRDTNELDEFYRQAAKDPSGTILSSAPDYDEKTFSIMKEFYTELGHSYRESQLSLCENTEKLLTEHIAELSTEINSKNRIFRAVTLFLAASVILILI